MTLEMVHIFLLKEYKERKNMKNGFLQTKKKVLENGHIPLCWRIH